MPVMVVMIVVLAVVMIVLMLVPMLVIVGMIVRMVMAVSVVCAGLDAHLPLPASTNSAHQSTSICFILSSSPPVICSW